MNTTEFASLTLRSELLDTVTSLGYTTMTPIQAKSLPPILAGKDIIAQAKTGSGKTAAFGLGIINKLTIAECRVQSLVLCPTRELADQVSKAIRQLARTLPNVKLLTICGGMPFRPQTISLEHGAHVVVGTPGRIGKHLRKRNLTLDDLKLLVLDEGDRMLDMGFREQLEAIIAEAPRRRQTLLFSATYPAGIQTLAEHVMIKPERVEVDSSHDSATIEQHFYEVSNEKERLQALRLLLLFRRPESTVIFCNTKKDVMLVTDAMLTFGFSALELHGDLEQRDRDEALVRFSNRSVSLLIATDVAARGLDIASVDAVLNYFISRDFDVHIHRIGRTGRAGNKGMAYSVYSEKERYRLSQLADYLGQVIEPEPLPTRHILNRPPFEAPMSTLKIKCGKKQKFRPGNLLGLLTGENGIEGSDVGTITIGDRWSYVGITCEAVLPALKKLGEETWRGQPIRAELLRNESSTNRELRQ